jgi:hypothetical protein
MHTWTVYNKDMLILKVCRRHNDSVLTVPILRGLEHSLVRLPVNAHRVPGAVQMLPTSRNRINKVRSISSRVWALLPAGSDVCRRHLASSHMDLVQQAEALLHGCASLERGYNS